MKYFDKIPLPVQAEFIKRGAKPDDFLYSVKADLDGNNCYYDMYIVLTEKELLIISGYETYDRINKKTKAPIISGYDVCDFKEISLKDIKNIYVDRYQYIARLVVVDSEDKEYHIAKFSLGFSSKFEKFSERVNKTINKEEINDAILEEQKTHCDICGEMFPDPNRPVCPNCVNKFSVFKRLIGMFKDFKFAIGMILLTIAVSNILVIVTPYFSSKMLIDDVLTEGGEYFGQVVMITVILFTVSLVSMLVRVISGIIVASVTPKVVHKLRTGIFASMQRLSLPFFTSKQTGSLMSRVQRDSDNIYWFFTDIVPYGITNVVKVVGIVALMIYISPIMALGVILSMGVINICYHKFFEGQKRLYRKLDLATRSANSVLSDVMNGQRVVKAFAREEKEIERFSDKNSDIFTTDTSINSEIANTIPFLWTTHRLFFAIIYCIGAFLVIRGNLQLGALITVLSYAGMINEPINFFTWIGNRWAKCVDAATRMFEILDSEPTVVEKENPIRIEEMKGNIEIKNVFFEYEAGRPIIKNMSFNVKAGQMFGIVGKTGAGKSTIINLMARLYDVTGGEILIDGIPLKDIAFEDLRKNIGIVSQETYLFMGSVADNIRYARPDASMDEVIEAAKSANAHEFISKMPDGYSTIIGEGSTRLSGGERQRISIARAIIQKPNILILDEATASMDTRTERKIQLAIDALKEGRTIIAIAHRLSTLRDADMLCVIENGEVKEMGTHDELIHQKLKYFELYKLQSEALKFINDGDN